MGETNRSNHIVRRPCFVSRTYVAVILTFFICYYFFISECLPKLHCLFLPSQLSPIPLPPHAPIIRYPPVYPSFSCPLSTVVKFREIFDLKYFVKILNEIFRKISEKL